MGRRAIVGAALLIGAALVVPAAGQPARATRAGTVVLKATLTGKYLHTASTGRGTARVTITASKVCWRFTYSGLDSRPGDSGIHIAPPPRAGQHKTSVFPFTASTSTAPGCVSKTGWGAAHAAWADKIAANPSHFYVILGTKKYPSPQGAIGGVLHGT